MPPTTFGWVLSRSDGTTRRGRLEHAEWADLTLEQVLHKLDDVVPEIPRDKRRLIHLGKILNKETEDNSLKTLKECGVKRGSVMWIMKVQEKFTPTELPEVTEAEMLSTIMMFHTEEFSLAMERLTEDKDYLGYLVAACPWLEQDPVALAFLAKPENLEMFTLEWKWNSRILPLHLQMDVWEDKMLKMAKEHPVLLPAIREILMRYICPFTYKLKKIEKI